MKFIKETLKTIFLKQENQKITLNLTPEQKKKYRKQYRKVMTYGVLTFIPLIYGLGDSIVIFLQTGELINIAHSIVFGITLEIIAQRIKIEIELIQERIEKREKKNLSQNKNLKETEDKE